ncbi:Uncharacterized protein BP5553_00544 [Venustampulla echinocandica]|uniref:Zn(2)-C6 fungal-type domain-containing protein n=1 Tax=Venustampulla echinocandica TaxID=2656787 RepID=A0A370TYG2_9HELO|nr:Uncharacterized protein BP5553_00544 [Venustampulla echinocandica]RDL40565.1 Uncharacterized protein BP5553_00544 [Venustampulla echinocandica]
MQQEALQGFGSPRICTDNPRRSPSQPLSPRSSSRAKTRTRNAIACDTCRSRRTKCDSRRPSCSYCRSRGIDCHYQPAVEAPASRFEVELAAINQRLDHLTNLLSSSPSHSYPHASHGSANSDDTREQFSDQENTPFKLLSTRRMMGVLGLEEDIADELVRMERKPLALNNPGSSRLYIVQHQQAVCALAAFSEHIHIWYPILGTGFSEQYFRIISGPLIPSPESCLVLLVAAIGLLAQETVQNSGLNGRADSSYFEAALASLPTVISDCGLTSVQCLVLFSIYYCCRLRPCQAHDYSLIASFKVQNLLKGFDSIEREDSETRAQAIRAYWAVLLLESELCAQFDLAKSGIWSLDEHVGLPDCRNTWQFDIDAGSPLAAISPASVPSTTSASTDKVQSYFLAETSMRRMLHRCNTAIKRNINGKIIYAPGIALELELQLDEWYNYLPEVVRFHTYLNPTTLEVPPVCPLSNFLRVQYYCCKTAIYWPAVYQAIEDGAANGQLLDHCRRFFDSYIQLMPSIIAAFQGCIVNRWTLFASIFMNSMATMKAVSTTCLAAIGSPQLYQCFASVRNVDQRIIEMSPSLALLRNAMEKKLAVG